MARRERTPNTCVAVGRKICEQLRQKQKLPMKKPHRMATFLTQSTRTFRDFSPRENLGSED